MKRKYWIIFFAVFITVLTQAPLLREKLGIDTQMLMLPFWCLALLITLYSNRRLRVTFTRYYYILFFSILFGCVVLSLISGENYFSGFTITIIMALFIFFIGNQNGEILFDDTLFMRLCIAYCSAATLLGIDIYLEYLSSYSLQSIDYVYRSKNSAGQILLTACVLLGYMLKNRKWKVAKVALIAFFLVEIILLRSRATILSVLFIPVTILLTTSVKRRYKYTTVAIITMAILFLTFNKDAYNLLINNVLFNSTNNVSLSALDLDRVTSNRYSLLSNFPTQLAGYEFTGLGSSFYVDNLFVNAIGNYGILFGLLVSILALVPLVESLRLKFKFTQFLIGKLIVLRIIIVTYTFNGLFEAWAPFGPGGKCFIFWLLLGMLYSGYVNKKEFANGPQ